MELTKIVGLRSFVKRAPDLKHLNVYFLVRSSLGPYLSESQKHWFSVLLWFTK